MKNSLLTITSLFSYESTHNDRLRMALVGAFLLHIMLLILLPKIPEFNMPFASREAGLNVFLKRVEETEKFEQTLNQQNALPKSTELVTEPSLGAASPERGEDPLVSEESPSVESASADNIENESSGKDTSARTPTKIITSWTALRRFTDLEVANYAQADQDELARFRRSFNSSRSYRRRSNIESYKNQYGDYYVRDSSSKGDICFKQEREQNPNELSTKTVYFFRCDDGPMKLDIKRKG